MEYSTNNGFGLLLPNRVDDKVVHKSGGVAITYPEFTGQFIPLESPIRSQTTKYIPNTSEFPDDGFPVSQIDESERDTIPPYICDRGYFESLYEYMNWRKKRPWAYMSWTSVLRAWNYDHKGDILGYNLRQHWGSSEEIWNQIDSQLPFIYDVISPSFTVERGRGISDKERQKLTSQLPDDQPVYGEGIRWIQITGTQSSDDILHSFSDFASLVGKKCVLLYPNCD